MMRPRIPLSCHDTANIQHRVGGCQVNWRIDFFKLFSICQPNFVKKEAPKGYVLNTEKMYFEVLKDGGIIKANMKDKKIAGTLEFTKTDVSTSQPLPNTLIEIYNDKDELIFSGRTDENGKIIIEELEYGKYYILEKEAPEGYQLNSNKMYFEIKEDGEIVK